jgi:hypothetical protein
MISTDYSEHKRVKRRQKPKAKLTAAIVDKSFRIKFRCAELALAMTRQTQADRLDGYR